MLMSCSTIALIPILREATARNARRPYKSLVRSIEVGRAVGGAATHGPLRESLAATIASSVFGISSRGTRISSVNGGSPFVCRGGRCDGRFFADGFKVKKSKRT